MKGTEADAKETYNRLTFDLAEAEAELKTPMIRAAYSGMDSADGARPGVLAGIDKPTISPSASPKSVYNVYDEFHRPTIVQMSYDGQNRFEVVTGMSNEKTHVVLYTDKRVSYMLPIVTGAAMDGNVYSDGHGTNIGSWNDGLVNGPTETGQGSNTWYIKKDMTIAGTYDGIDGTYKCFYVVNKEPGCVVGDEESGTPQGVIRFVPDRVEGDDYLTFGVWLTVPEQVEDDHSVGAFATGNDPFKGDVSELKGTATYEGPAVGIYGKRETDSTTSDVGSFTATAYLTAKLANGQVYGDVTNFEENGESLGSWNVELNPGVRTGDPSHGLKFIGGTQNSNMGKGIDLKSTGKWTGQFYGNGKATDHPGSVAGTFNAKTGTPKKTVGDQGFLGIVGAFGAKKVMPPPAR